MHGICASREEMMRTPVYKAFEAKVVELKGALPQRHVVHRRLRSGRVQAVYRTNASLEGRIRKEAVSKVSFTATMTWPARNERAKWGGLRKFIGVVISSTQLESRGFRAECWQAVG